MELGARLKEYRTQLGLSQDDLAERVYVSRQTISAWENDKTYPDIHSLLMLSDLFRVSLDTLVKGDIEIMRKEVSQADIRGFRKDSIIFAVLFFIIAVSLTPLYKWLGIPGLIIWASLFVAELFFAGRVDQAKKQHDIHTYREITAFMNGEKLDSIEKEREKDKRRQQKYLFFAACGILAFTVSWFITTLLRG